MRRQDKLMSHEDCIDVIKNNNHGFMATVNADGTPYINGLNYIYKDSALFIHCAREGQKLENIERQNKVCFNIVDSVEVVQNQFTLHFRSVLINGTAEIIKDQDEIRKHMLDLAASLSPDFIEGGIKYVNAKETGVYIIKITIDEMSGKAKL